jgi:hypothetical protein
MAHDNEGGDGMSRYRDIKQGIARVGAPRLRAARDEPPSLARRSDPPGLHGGLIL